jgi:hypothetical protein
MYCTVLYCKQTKDEEMNINEMKKRIQKRWVRSVSILETANGNSIAYPCKI